MNRASTVLRTLSGKERKGAVSFIGEGWECTDHSTGQHFWVKRQVVVVGGGGQAPFAGSL